MHLGERDKRHEFDESAGWLLFVECAPTPWQLVMTLLVHFNQHAREVVTLEEAQEYNQMVVLSAYEM